MYLSAAIAFIYYIVTETDSKRIVKIFFIVIVPYFIFHIFLLSSRAGYISFVFMLLSVTFFIFLRYKQKLLSVSFLLLLIFFAILLLKNPRIIRNFNELSNLFSEKSNTVENYNAHDYIVNIIKNNENNIYDARFYVWKSSIETIKENFWTGVGVSNADAELEKRLVKFGFDSKTVKSFNSHNQFLDTWIEVGIVGVLLLLSVFISAFIISLKRKDALFFILTGILFINLFFETMLNRFAGVAFFALFFSLFLFPKNNKQTIQKKRTN
jgi:O-antigen ligase